jgi:hypothetical protein
MFDDEVYVGDDGVLSSEDGTFWNPADDKSGSQLTGALDEFGEPTYVEMTADFIGGTFIGVATNELQDNGVQAVELPITQLNGKGCWLMPLTIWHSMCTMKILSNIVPH